jgi:carbamoyl-phosphate synthase large subunit
MVRIAIGVMRGRSIEGQGYTPGLVPTRNLVAVKAPVFSMAKLTGVDTFLGPEMKSTGEVMGIDTEYAPAVAKAFVAAGLTIPERGAVLLSIADRDKEDAVDLVRGLADRGHPLMATAGTAALIRKLGIPVREVEKKLSGRRPNALDVIEDQTATAVINTVTGDRSTLQDGFDIRRAAAERRIPCFTSIDTARAAVEAMTPHGDRYSVKRLAEYLDGG